MLARRFIGKMKIAGVILYAIGLVAITGCGGATVTRFTGHYDASCNCCRPGGSGCEVITIIMSGGYEVAKYIVDLR